MNETVEKNNLTYFLPFLGGSLVYNHEYCLRHFLFWIHSPAEYYLLKDKKHVGNVTFCIYLYLKA